MNVGGVIAPCPSYVDGVDDAMYVVDLQGWDCTGCSNCMGNGLVDTVWSYTEIDLERRSYNLEQMSPGCFDDNPFRCPDQFAVCSILGETELQGATRIRLCLAINEPINNNFTVRCDDGCWEVAANYYHLIGLAAIHNPVTGAWGFKAELLETMMRRNVAEGSVEIVSLELITSQGNGVGMLRGFNAEVVFTQIDNQTGVAVTSTTTVGFDVRNVCSCGGGSGPGGQLVVSGRSRLRSLRRGGTRPDPQLNTAGDVLRRMFN